MFLLKQNFKIGLKKEKVQFGNEPDKEKYLNMKAGLNIAVSKPLVTF